MCKVKGCVAGPGLEKQIVATKKSLDVEALLQKRVFSFSCAQFVHSGQL